MRVRACGLKLTVVQGDLHIPLLLWHLIAHSICNYMCIHLTHHLLTVYVFILSTSQKAAVREVEFMKYQYYDEGKLFKIVQAACDVLGKQESEREMKEGSGVVCVCVCVLDKESYNNHYTTKMYD